MEKERASKPPLIDPPSSDDEEDVSRIDLIKQMQTVGPGVWYSIHLLAARSSTPSPLQTLVYEIAAGFICKECSEHVAYYLARNPIQPAAIAARGAAERRRCIFNWTIDFHNSVNYRIGKPFFTPDEADALFARLSARR